MKAFDRKLSSRIKNCNAFIERRNHPVAVTLEDGNIAYVFALTHCGAMGTLNRNGKKRSFGKAVG